MGTEPPARRWGRAILVGAVAGILHLILWVVIGAVASRLTGDGKWSYYFGGFLLVASPIVGMLYGSLFTPGLKYVKILIPLSIPIVYVLFGASMHSAVPNSGIMWLLLALVGLPITVDLFRRYRRLPEPTASEWAEATAQVPPEIRTSPLKENRLGCGILLVLGLVGAISAIVGGILPKAPSGKTPDVADRLVFGGLCLAVAAVVWAAVLQMLRTKKVATYRSMWRSEVTWLDRREAPGWYRFWLILLFILGAAMFVMSVAAFMGHLPGPDGPKGP